MTTNRSNGRQTLIGLVLVVILLLLLFTIVHWLWHVLSRQYFVTLVVAILGVGGSVWTARSTKLKDRELQIQAQQAEKREGVCRTFMSNIWSVTQHTDKAKDQDFVEAMMKDIMVNGLLWWSDRTVKSFVDFRRLSERDQQRTLVYAARIILSIRTDLGHKNDGLTEKDVLDVFLTGTDALFNE